MRAHFAWTGALGLVFAVGCSSADGGNTQGASGDQLGERFTSKLPTGTFVNDGEILTVYPDWTSKGITLAYGGGDPQCHGDVDVADGRTSFKNGVCQLNFVTQDKDTIVLSGQINYQDIHSDVATFTRRKSGDLEGSYKLDAASNGVPNVSAELVIQRSSEGDDASAALHYSLHYTDLYGVESNLRFVDATSDPKSSKPTAYTTTLDNGVVMTLQLYRGGGKYGFRVRCDDHAGKDGAKCIFQTGDVGFDLPYSGPAQ
jgi:hypothetical protein